MRIRIVLIALVIAIISGCGKKETVQVSTSVDGSYNMETPSQIYILKPVEHPNDEVNGNAMEGARRTSESDEFSDDNMAIGTGVADEEIQESTLGQQELELYDIVRDIAIPDSLVVIMNFGVPGIGIVAGEMGEYKLQGTEACFMWESDNGTFYKDIEGVKRVEVSGRSALFTESQDDSDDLYVDTNIGISTDSISVDELREVMSGTSDIEYKGIQNYRGEDCYVISMKTDNEDGSIANVDVYISESRKSMVGMCAYQDEMVIEIAMNDYVQFIGDLESQVSGTIDDETATDTVNNAMLGGMLSMMFSAMGASGM